MSAMMLLGIQLAYAQMSLDQKLSDFGQLAGLFSKHYSFTEWKQQAIQYNSLDLAPWISRIQNGTDDLSFFEVCMEYVAANQDAHTTFILPTTYEAALGFTADLYDGKALIDNIDQTVVDTTIFPAQIGDELVSVDGKPIADIITSYLPFINDGNSRSARRTATTLATVRVQEYIPRAPEVGDTATVVVRRQSGNLETYTLPWQKSGDAYTIVGPAPDPQSHAAAARLRARTSPAWQQVLESLHNLRARHTKLDVIDASNLKPVFGLPDGFVQRLGNGSFDDFFTGTFTANGLRIGYLRYPAFDFFLNSELSKEVAYFQANTDGLIIDVMGNPGGDTCTLENFVQYFMPSGFHSLGQAIRADWGIVMMYQDAVASAIQDGSYTDDEIAQMQAQADAVRSAYSQNRGFTDPLPLCSLSQDVPTVADRTGKSVAYTKPIMVLTDELSYSAAEAFAAIMQDNGRALLYGMHTDGAGGSPSDFAVGVYMEAAASIAQTKIIRKAPIKTGSYPAAPYIENIGVLPDHVYDYMTTDNLLQKGQPLVTDFTRTMVNYINSQKQQ
jgi:C-terminal processing protease CtpA/Prc